MTYSATIRLIKKQTTAVVPVTIKGDTTGNMVPYRISGAYRDTVNEVIPNGQMTIRAPFGLFDSVEPILTDERAKHKYLIEVRLAQGGANTNLFRFEIASTTVSDSNQGKHITLQLMSPAIRLKESHDSSRLSFLTPREAFAARMNKFLSNSLKSIVINLPSGWNMLPNRRSLRDIWNPLEPTPTLELLGDIIRRVSQPNLVQSTNEDYYFKVIADPSYGTFHSMLIAKMGEVNMGLTVSVKPEGTTQTAAYDVTKDTDNKRYKNSLILKGPRGAHSYPMVFTRYASDITHTHPDYTDVWQSGEEYDVGDYVVDGDSNGYKCLVAHTSSSSNRYSLSGDNTYWKNLSYDTEHSPFTNDVSVWERNMDGQNNKLGYKGYFHDFNIVRKFYQRDKARDDFATISIKDVEGKSGSPPSNPKHGQRWLVGTGRGAWSGQDNKIAHWHNGEWLFSDTPLANDSTINVRDDATVIQWDGSKYVEKWNLANYTEDSIPSPFFPVKNIFIDVGPNGKSRNAIKIVFDWNFVGDSAEDVVAQFDDFIYGLGEAVV